MTSAQLAAFVPAVLAAHPFAWAAAPIHRYIAERRPDLLPHCGLIGVMAPSETVGPGARELTDLLSRYKIHADFARWAPSLPAEVSLVGMPLLMSRGQAVRLAPADQRLYGRYLLGALAIVATLPKVTPTERIPFVLLIPEVCPQRDSGEVLWCFHTERGKESNAGRLRQRRGQRARRWGGGVL